MCVVSAVSDYYRIPREYTQPVWPLPPVQEMDPEVKELLRRAIEILEKVDKKLGDVECKDETKEKFLRDIGYNQESGE